jgi:hypothetical protein
MLASKHYLVLEKTCAEKTAGSATSLTPPRRIRQASPTNNLPRKTPAQDRLFPHDSGLFNPGRARYLVRHARRSLSRVPKTRRRTL